MLVTIVFVGVFLVLLVAVCVSLVLLSVLLVKKFKKNDGEKAQKGLFKSGIITGVALVSCVIVIGISQVTTSTPSIVDESGRTIEGSISELVEVDLNGTKQWISIRGNNVENPIILFLAGGPGGSQMAAVRHELGELERDFVVVNWDQPGSGKSYSALPIEKLTREVYIQDGIALSEYLCERFDENEIILVGESWGSSLGVFMAEERPDLYQAFLGTGQMVDFLETEMIDYDLALELAHEEGNSELITTLSDNGTPPYYGSDVTWKSAAYLNYLSSKMARDPEITDGGYNTLRDLMGEEYGIIDKMNYVRGVIDTFNQVYPQLYEIDLREDYSVLEVPAYFLLGRHDINAPTTLVEEYYEVLEAPTKEIVWFEYSGHSPWINESDKFVDTVKRLVK